MPYAYLPAPLPVLYICCEIVKMWYLMVFIKTTLLILSASQPERKPEHFLFWHPWRSLTSFDSYQIISHLDGIMKKLQAKTMILLMHCVMVSCRHAEEQNIPTMIFVWWFEIQHETLSIYARCILIYILVWWCQKSTWNCGKIRRLHSTRYTHYTDFVRLAAVIDVHQSPEQTLDRTGIMP